MTWKEFLQHNIDKILLILVFHGLMVLMVSNLTNPTLFDWVKGEAGTVLGALLMLITGRASKPEPTITSQTTTTQSVTVPPLPTTEPDSLENPANVPAAESKPDLPVFAGEK